MALTAKIRGQWRVVSKAMARRFRARGIQVYEAPIGVVVHEEPGRVTFEPEDDFLARQQTKHDAWPQDNANASTPPPATIVLPDVVQAYSPPLPPLKLPAEVAITPPGATRVVVELQHDSHDISDDELEWLTAPSKTDAEP